MNISDDWRITRTLYKISFLYVCIQFFIVIMKQISIMSAFGKNWNKILEFSRRVLCLWTFTNILFAFAHILLEFVFFLFSFHRYFIEKTNKQTNILHSFLVVLRVYCTNILCTFCKHCKNVFFNFSLTFSTVILINLRRFGWHFILSIIQSFFLEYFTRTMFTF